MGYLIRYSVAFSLVLVLWAAPCLAEQAAPPSSRVGIPPIELPVKVVEDWPEDIPCPPGFTKRLASATANHFVGQVDGRFSFEELTSFYGREMERWGWKRRVYEAEIPGNIESFNIECTLDSRTMNVFESGYTEPGQFWGVHIEVRDSSMSCPVAVMSSDPETGILIAAMHDAYATAKSYSDTGVATLSNRLFVPGGDESPPTQEVFTTTYVAPDKLRFECNVSGRYILHRGGEVIRSYSSSDRKEKSLKSLRDGFFPPNFLAYGDVETVPDLLGLREYPSPRLLNAHIIGDEVLDGTRCRVIEYYKANCMPGRMWVAIDDKTLRRTEIYDHTHVGTWQHVTTYRPALDQVVPTEQLAFNKAGQLDLPNEPGLVERTTQSVIDVLSFWF